MDLEKLREMIQPTVAVPDNTRNEAYQVFGEKSTEGDQIKQISKDTLNNMGLSDSDILEIVMGVSGVPSGGGIMKTLKGMGGGIKGLAGKISSKMKFPQGYGAPQSPGTSQKLPSFIKNQINKVQPNPLKQEAIKQEEIRKALNQLMNPNTVIKEEGIKGMHQFGKFNRQRNK